MADALGLCLKKLRSNLMRYYSHPPGTEALDSKRMMVESFDRLMDHLRDMMTGYENDQVQDLLKEMEGMAASEAWNRHEEPVMDKLPRYGDEDMEEIGVSGSWYKREEKIMDRMIVICEQLCNIRYNSNIHGEDDFVGFDKEVETLLDQLTGSSAKQLQIISIAGMAGLGKTTLARKLYNHPLIEYMFDFRAWTCVSQVYLKKDLLLDILCSFIDDNCTDTIYNMSEVKLGERVYRLLKGRKYLVVLDDIWDCKVWNDLKMYFPDDKTGSRVIFTRRDVEMNSDVHAARPAHVLRLRTEGESWMIFLKKVFRTGICPARLESLGYVISKKCEGLPLAISIAAGLLKNNLSFTWWRKIATSLRSFIVSDPSQYMDSLALSYNHLPPHLRPCFLYFGAFPEDYEVSVTKLIWLWIAHGFIHETGTRMLEDVAKDFLMDLINRSLVMTPTVKDDGQVKTCRIHDLLRNFCLRKAEEEDFLSKISRYGMVSSKLCSPLEIGKLLQESGTILIDTYEFLRILDIGSITIFSFPSDVVRLVNLRYLAIKAHDGSPPASVSNLVQLQMLIISSRKNVLLPKTIWNMVKLRHLYLKSGENLLEGPSLLQVTENDDCSSVLASLQTLSQVSPRSSQNILPRTPNIRELGFCGPLISTLGDLEFPNLGSMEHLEKLKLFNTFTYHETTRSCNPIMFPQKLKKLTLSNTGMDWEEMWTFSLLPNLEVLNLKFNACIGEKWETGDAEFRQLKILKLHNLGIRQWISSRDNFPRLQHLVVRRCTKLNCIPLGLGKILTLEVIEVSECSTSAYKSAKDIQNEQEGEGNCFLKVHAKRFPTKNLKEPPSSLRARMIALQL
ncbi:putative P-loop containing nucleoside triphosphate hydrolase, leucine-rich repeat domain superfamily [Helianthus annuus]|nr:putative P-loop containing nucleoside triphosphate hydrolase, leucine-rich repeat domain superfamily [Helianthus annuus]